MRCGWLQIGLLLMGLFLIAGQASAVPDDVTFPEPHRSGGRGFFQVLQGRTETERFDARLLHWEIIGNLLWAGCGVNRPDEGGRTIPDLAERLPVRVYLLAAEGIWLYEPFTHRLVGLQGGDFRPLATAWRADVPGELGFDRDRGDADARYGAAPVVLLLAAAAPLAFGGFAQQAEADRIQELVLAALEAGHIAQNIQLFAVSQGLGVQVHTRLAQAKTLARQLELPGPDQILMALSVGYPHPR